MKELATRIDAHLKRFEKNPVINAERFYVHPGTGEKTSSGHPYYRAGAVASGRWIYVTYIAYQEHPHISKDEAIKYLAWLDASNVGRYVWEKD